MNTLRLRLGALLLLPFLLTACDSADPSAETVSASPADARPADHCVNVNGMAAFDLGFPVVLPPPLDITGGGALPTWVDLGPIEGTLSSVLTDPGDGGPGAQHWTLVHYFVDDDGDAFWTEDRAVCTPVGNDPALCRVNDVMTVVGGTGKFANASGRLLNHGLATITDPTFSTSPYGSLTGRLHGRLCGDGL